MSEITCDNTEPPTDGEKTLPKRAKTEQAENGPCSDARSGQAGAGRAQRSDAAAGRPLRSDARSSQARAGRAQRSDAAAGRGRPLCFDARAAGADGSGIAAAGAAGAEKEDVAAKEEGGTGAKDAGLAMPHLCRQARQQLLLRDPECRLGTLLSEASQ